MHFGTVWEPCPHGPRRADDLKRPFRDAELGERVQVRMVATIKLMPEFDREKTCLELMRIATMEGLREGGPRERATVYFAPAPGSFTRVTV